MKKIFTTSLIVATCLLLSSMAIGQIINSNFTVSKIIKPSDFAGNIWPDSVAAWRAYGPYDLDKNGKKEFLVIVDPTTTSLDTTSARILRFEATANDKYDLVWSAKIPSQNTAKGSWPCLTVSDFDKDGNQEIIFGLPSDARTSPNPNPDIIFIYEYDPVTKNFPKDPTMTSGLGFPAKYYYAITSIVANDVDNDGDVEMILSARRAYGGGSGNASLRPLLIYHLLGDVSPGFSSFELEFIDTLGTFNGGYYHNNHVVDFDGNGKKEIWGFTWDMVAYAVYEATAKDTYVLKADVNQATAPDDYGEQNSVGFYDANHDGKLEMFLAGQVSPPSAVFYLPNTNNLASLDTSSEKMITPAFGSANFQGASIGDVDGNGEVDFAIGDYGSSRSVYLLSHIKGMPFDSVKGYKFDTLYSAPNDSTFAFPNVLMTKDMDGDGKGEIIIVNTKTRAGKADPSIIILESKVVTVSVKQISELTPNKFSLEQNFPNPFNPTSTIRFSLKTEDRVELFITNSIGQQVGSLVNEKLGAGTHEVVFNADGLSSGAYFYTLKSGNFIETKKMTLLK